MKPRWICTFCDEIILPVDPVCYRHRIHMRHIGAALRRALTPSRIAKAIMSAHRNRTRNIDPQAWERAFGPDYANRILWFSKDYGAFRITEDGTAADVDDNLIPLPPQPWVSAIPDDVGPMQWDRWMQIFNDYDIISPIGQWSRGKN